MSRVTGYFNTDFPEPPRQSPNASAETNTYATEKMVFGRGHGGGKGSHSRQWRLSMAVFLNRNKRPQAAPIEVAELLSEKPPPSHPPSVPPLREGARGRGKTAIAASGG